MAKYLLSLLLLLLGINNALAQACYCTSNWRPDSTFGNACTANADCWACQQGAYSSAWQQTFCPNIYPAPVPVTCTTTFTEKTESCQVNYSGIKRLKQETRTCTDGQVTVHPWQLYSDSCVQNPPTCQVTSQQQTLACQTGYTGSIIQTRSSTCPNPYGSPVWQPWVTTSNSCVKSVTNPTNLTSPVSPVSPVNPTSVLTTPSSPATAATTSSVQSSPTTTAGSSAPTPESSAPSSTAPTDAKATSQETTTSAPTTTGSQTTSTTSVTLTPAPKGKTQSAVGLVLSLEVFVKPGLSQPTMFVEPSLVNGIPNEFLMQDSVMSLMFQPTINQHLEPQDLGFEQ